MDDEGTGGLITVVVVFLLLLGGSCYWLGNKHGADKYVEASEQYATEKAGKSYLDGQQFGYKEGLKDGFKACLKEEDDDKRR